MLCCMIIWSGTSGDNPPRARSSIFVDGQRGATLDRFDRLDRKLPTQTGRAACPERLSISAGRRLWGLVAGRVNPTVINSAGGSRADATQGTES
jgi:hypothetical protein